MAKSSEVSRKVLGPLAEDTDSNSRFVREQIRALADNGFMGLTFPTEYGGLGHGALAYAESTVELAKACASTAMVYVMHVCGSMIIAEKGSEEQKKKYLPALAKDGKIATLAFSERGSGAHFYTPVSRVTRDEEGFTLNCEKSFVTSAGEADVYMVSTGASRAESLFDSDIFIVEKGQDCITVQGPWRGMGMRGNSSAPMSFRDCRVPLENLVGEERDGFQIILQVVLPWFHIGLAAVSVGLAEAAIDLSVKHAINRRYDHTGQNLASIPSIQGHIGDMGTQTRTARIFLENTARSFESKDPTVLQDLLELRVFATQAALDVTQSAMRVCGGSAFAKHLPIERLLRDSYAGSIMAPTVDVLREVVGRVTLGLNPF